MPNAYVIPNDIDPQHVADLLCHAVESPPPWIGDVLADKSFREVHYGTHWYSEGAALADPDFALTILYASDPSRPDVVDAQAVITAGHVMAGLWTMHSRYPHQYATWRRHGPCASVAATFLACILYPQPKVH